MLELLRIAPLSSVQDGGRDAWRHVGVPPSGPLDHWSHAVANVLVGNDPASEVYVRNKLKAGAGVGFRADLERLAGESPPPDPPAA